MIGRFTLALAVSIAGMVAGSTAVAQTWQQDSGLTLLRQQFPNVETGIGLTIGQVEAPLNQAGTTYLPNVNSGEFANKTITDVTGVGATSNHANTVLTRLCGENSGAAPDIGSVSVFEAVDYLETRLSFGGGNPFTTVYTVENHSWIANGLAVADATQLLQRTDWRVEETNMNLVVGTNNGGATPQLMVPAYNLISVGRLNGTHARSDTNFYGSGRQKPEIVSPGGVTSFSTPVVAGSAAILRDAASGTDATNNEVIKAILLGGADKRRFPAWSRSPTRPIDDTFGFGLVNIYRSYMILLGGESDGNTGVAVPMLGYDYGESITPGTPMEYQFSFPNGAIDFSVALTWNIQITDTNPGGFFTPSASLADFSMELVDSSGAVIDSSDSAVNNIEHIFQTNLAAGDYTLRVSSDTNRDFGLAWFASPGATLMESFTLVNGTLSGGGLANLAASDNQDVVAFRNVLDVQSRAVFEFESTSAVPDPVDLEVVLEGSVFSRSNVAQSIDLFNYVTGSWDEIDSQNASRFGDNVVVANAGATPADYIEPGTNRVEARVRFLSAVQRQQFSAAIDQIFFRIR